MRFTELSNIAPYHDTLNPVLWENDHLKTDVRYKLMLIAQHFSQFLNVEHLDLVDITISGSNASFGYSEYSDIDLHLIINISSPDLGELVDAKKNQYNFKYDLSIKDIPVEVYVQDSKQQHISTGIYSILNNKWISKPEYRPHNVSDDEINNKATTYQSQIDQALTSSSLKLAVDTFNDIKRLRQAGLELGGEFSVENLAFKALRTTGKLDKLRKHIDKLQSAELSLREQQ